MKTQKRFKIGILVDQLTIGGVQKIAIEDARALTKLGHHAEVLVLMRKGYRQNYKDFHKGVKVRFLSDSYPLFLRHSFKFPIFSFFSTLHILSPIFAPYVIKDKEFDIIIGHGTTTCFTAKSLSQRRQIPYLAAVHDPMVYILKKAYSQSILKIFFPILTPILIRLETSLIENSQKVLLLSKLHEKFISNTYAIAPVILPAATTIINVLPKKQRSYIFAASRWEKQKNPKLFLEIAKHTGANIKIAGAWTSKSDYQNFKREINNNGLSGKIKLYPLVSEHRLQELYQGARLFVHPIIEAFSMGGLEAAANGCPIVIPQGSGITQHLKDKQDGIFIRKSTNRNFIQAVESLWQNPKLAGKMGKSARKKVFKLSWKNHAKNLEKIIKKSLSEKTIVALETGHSSESYLAGGDKLLEKMAYSFDNNLKINVILPSIGKKHWENSGLKVKLSILPNIYFDNRPSPYWVFLAYLVRIWKTYWKLNRIKKINFLYSSTNVLPDIAPAFFYKLTHSQTPWVARVHHLIAKPTKRPGKLTVNVVSYLMQAVSSWMIKNRADKILALNNKLEEKLFCQKFPKYKLAVLGAGINYPQIAKTIPFKNKNFDGIFVGRIHPSKGIYDLVKIWQDVVSQRPGAKALIVGEGAQEEKNNLKRQIKKASLEKNLFLSGYLPDKLLYKTLKSSRIFLFTDYEAGWGLAIGEAMAAGLPVVGYDLEIFGDVYNKGFVSVPRGNISDFSQKVVLLLKNSKFYASLSKQAISQAKLLSWQKTSSKFLSILNN